MATQIHSFPAAWRTPHAVTPEAKGRPGFNRWHDTWRDLAKRRCLRRVFGHDRLSGTLVLDVGSNTECFLDWYQGRGAK